MMRLFFIIHLTVTTFLYSDVGTYLYTKNTRCVYDLAPNQNGNGFCYRYSDNPNTLRCSTRSKITQFIAGYDYNATSDTCALEHDLAITGLRYDDKNRIVAYIALSIFTVFILALIFVF